MPGLHCITDTRQCPRIPGLYHIQGIDHIKMADFNWKAEAKEQLCFLWRTYRSLFFQCQCYCQFWKSFNPVDIQISKFFTDWQTDKNDCLTPSCMRVLGNDDATTYQFWWSPWQHCCSHCSWWPQYWQCVSHCRVQWLEHLSHWWWLDWGLDWQWWCSWLEPHHHTVGAATALWGSHCPDHTAEQCRKESGEERECL